MQGETSTCNIFFTCMPLTEYLEQAKLICERLVYMHMYLVHFFPFCANYLSEQMNLNIQATEP